MKKTLSTSCWRSVAVREAGDMRVAIEKDSQTVSQKGSVGMVTS